MSANAYRKCSKCGISAVQDKSIKLHRFPKPGTTNIMRAMAWATFCWPDQDWSSLKSLSTLYTSGKQLCGRHFDDSCYVDNMKKRLSRYAVPGSKEYIIKMMRFLRSNISIPSIVQQVKSSQDPPVAGCSTDPGIPAGRSVAPPLGSAAELATPSTTRDRVTGVYVNPKPENTTLSAPNIDLVQKLSVETHTVLTHTFDSPAAFDDVLANDVPADDLSPVPVPEAEDPTERRLFSSQRTELIEAGKQEVEDPAEKNLFSWQKTELIEADDPEEPPPRARSPPVDPTLALYCDSDPEPDQTVPSEPAPAEKDDENRCKDCGEVNDGFEFWCVQCAGGALCGACAGRAPHHAHYVLRAPMGCIRTRTQAVLALIRQQLQNQNLLSQHETVDDGLKVEVKEEPCEEPPASVAPPAPARAPAPAPSEPDPLACDPQDTSEPDHQCIAEQIVDRHDHHEPLKLPRLPEALAHKANLPLVQRKVVKVSPGKVKLAFISHLERIVTTQQQSKSQSTSQTFKENLTQHAKARQYLGPKNTSQTAGNFTGIQHNQVKPQPSMKVTSEPKPSENVIIDLDEDETVEYLEEGLESDIETVEEVVIDDNESTTDDRETNVDDDGLDDRETNEDGDRLHDYDDDDVLDEDYLVDEDDLTEDDESDEDGIRNVARNSAKRSIDAKQTLLVSGPSGSMIRDDDLSDENPIVSVVGRGVKRRNVSTRHPSESIIQDDLIEDLSDEDSIVNVAGRGVKRKKDAEETSPVKGPCDSMARALPTKVVVQVQPLSSLEIRNWTADRKRLSKD